MIVGPALAVTGTNLSATQSIPADGILQIAFNRLLHPATIVRQSFLLQDKSGNNYNPLVQYDPVARVVTLAMPSDTPFVVGNTYTVTMPVPKDFELNDGPRAIDLATLPSQQTLTFQVSAATGQTWGDRPIDFCDDVLAIFQNRCSGGPCHLLPRGSELPAEGLILETSTGVLDTAIGRVAQESNTGAQAGLGSPAAKPFGVQMPIVDPNHAGNSWLMYKVLLAATRPVDQGLDAGASICTAGGAAPGPVFIGATPPIAPMSDDERARLSEYVLGNSMPYPLNLPPDEPTPVGPTDDESSTLPCTFDELERIRAWIAQGAPVKDCSACPGGN